MPRPKGSKNKTKKETGFSFDPKKEDETIAKEYQKQDQEMKVVIDAYLSAEKSRKEGRPSLGKDLTKKGLMQVYAGVGITRRNENVIKIDMDIWNLLGSSVALIIGFIVDYERGRILEHGKSVVNDPVDTLISVEDFNNEEVNSPWIEAFRLLNLLAVADLSSGENGNVFVKLDRQALGDYMDRKLKNS